MTMSGKQMRTMALLLAIGGAAVLSGCATTAGIEGSAATTWGPDGERQTSKFVVINNEKLAKGIQIVDMKSGFAGDLMKANVTLVSKNTDTLSFQYKFAWFDLQGMEINPDAGAWKPLILYGNETKTIQGVAPNPTAREYKIKIRD